MVFTQFGRIEFDPMRVPLAKSAAGTGGAAFADRLEQATRRSEPEPTRDEATPRSEEPTCSPECERAPDDAPTDEAAEPEVEAPELPADTQASPVAGPDQPEISRESPTRRDDAGEGVGVSLEPSPARKSMPLAAVGAGQAAGAHSAPVAPGFALNPLEAVQQAKATTRTDVDRLVGVQAASPARATAAAANVQGYRSRNAFAVQLDDQARDSVFKQILFKLGKEGSEMRMRLEPPELGELDLHMTVDGANTLKLSITTERTDLRDLLRGGLQQLEQELQAGGLRIAHAEVNSREGRDPSAHHDFGTAFGGPSLTEETETTAAAVRSGWVSANGLDFWV